MNAVLDAYDPTAITQSVKSSHEVDLTDSNLVLIHPTWLEKLTVSGSALGFATVMFIFSALVLIPHTNTFMRWIELSESIQQVVILFLMLGLPILAAMQGIRLGSKTTFANR